MVIGSSSSRGPRRWCLVAAIVTVLTAGAPVGLAERALLRPTVCYIDPGAPRHYDAVPTLAELAERERAQFGNGRTIHGHGGDHYVAFTFDDGPKQGTTERVLDALERYGVPATFFVVSWRFSGKGKHSARNLDVLHDIVNRGFHIGNHTARHKNMAQVAPEVMKAEIERGADAIEEELGIRPYLFRPPYGAMSQRANAFVASKGYTVARWNIDSLDFLHHKETKVRRRVVDLIVEKKGGVVLMHDTKEVTARALPGILDDLEKENCRRLEAGKRLLVPVSLHYFMKNERGEARPIPPDVAARTERYLQELPGRCRERSAPAP